MPIGHRFEANGRRPRVVTLRWSPRLYFAVYILSSLKEHSVPSNENMRLSQRDVKQHRSAAVDLGM